MVVWVFAGGGEAEVRGLIPFLQQNFPNCRFERKTPIRQKPGPKPNKAASYGKTGQSLIEQITRELPIALNNTKQICQLILVIDDLDCRDSEQQKQTFLQAISSIQESPEINNIDKFVGFSAPEIEAWIIADWDNSIGKHPDFRSRHQRMRHWLSTEKKVPFNAPESFSEYDSERDCCQDKLSELLIESTRFYEDRERKLTIFSKSLHTSQLLWLINPKIIQQKCPLFRELYNHLNNLNQT
nr:DUF4276 family protein [Gloeothece verrucosa]